MDEQGTRSTDHTLYAHMRRSVGAGGHGWGATGTNYAGAHVRDHDRNAGSLGHDHGLDHWRNRKDEPLSIDDDRG
jgi:hypothetical protein